MNESYVPLLRRILEGIAYEPSRLIIKELRTVNGAVQILVTATRTDTGFICGGQGKNLRAIQKLFYKIAEQRGDTVKIIVDSFDGEAKRQPERFSTVNSWTRTQEAIDLAGDILKHAGYRPRRISGIDQYDRTILTFDTKGLDEILPSLDIVIHAWGKSQGRKISLSHDESGEA